MNAPTSAAYGNTQTTASMSDAHNDIAVLNAELGGEYFGIAAYSAALGTGLLTPGVSEVAEKFQGDHKAHAEHLIAAIADLGGEPVCAKSWDEYAAESPPPALETEEDVLRYAASLELGGASASVAAVAQLRSSQLGALIASISGVEAMHWSVLLGALGDDPAPVAFIPLPKD